MIKCFDVSNELVLENPLYKADLERYAYEGGMDITSKALGITDDIVDARIVAKSDGIFCGNQETMYLLRNFQVKMCKNDGDQIRNGNIVCEFAGSGREILKVERVLLNLLMRMSGIATFTREMVEIAGSYVLLVPTRKTLWGMLDKRACSVGGGGTHRLNLEDAILIKENHLELIGSIEKALELALKSDFRPRFIEIEVKNENEAEIAVNALNKFKIDVPKVIMFDNMNAEDIRRILGKIGDFDVIFEASGGINKGNLAEYAKSGVDIISMGQLTMEAKVLDFSLMLSQPSKMLN